MPNDEPSHRVARLFARLQEARLDGRRECLEELVDCFLPGLHRWFGRNVSPDNPDLDPDDLTQDCVLTILRALPSFELRSEGALVNWVYAVAQNTLRDRRGYSNAQRRRRSRIDRDAKLDEQASPDEADDFLERETQRRAIDAALDQLTPEQREAILLDLTGLPHKELARQLGIDVNAFDLRLSRAKHKLRENLRDDDPARAGEDTTP